MLDELADPLGVLNVGLPAGDVLEVLGVKKPALEVVFEQVVDNPMCEFMERVTSRVEGVGCPSDG